LTPNNPLKKALKSKGAAKESKRRVPSVAFFVLREVEIGKKSSNEPRKSGEECKKMGGKKRTIK
jgi:hypothetical protein